MSPIQRFQQITRLIGGAREIRRQGLAREIQRLRQRLEGVAPVLLSEPPPDDGVDARRRKRLLHQILEQRACQFIDGGSDLSGGGRAPRPDR